MEKLTQFLLLIYSLLNVSSINWLFKSLKDLIFSFIAYDFWLFNLYLGHLNFRLLAGAWGDIDVLLLPPSIDDNKSVCVLDLRVVSDRDLYAITLLLVYVNSFNRGTFGYQLSQMAASLLRVKVGALFEVQMLELVAQTDEASKQLLR